MLEREEVSETLRTTRGRTFLSFKPTGRADLEISAQGNSLPLLVSSKLKTL